MHRVPSRCDIEVPFVGQLANVVLLKVDAAAQALVCGQLKQLVSMVNHPSAGIYTNHAPFTVIGTRVRSDSTQHSSSSSSAKTSIKHATQTCHRGYASSVQK